MKKPFIQKLLLKSIKLKIINKLKNKSLNKSTFLALKLWLNNFFSLFYFKLNLINICGYINLKGTEVLSNL